MPSQVSQVTFSGGIDRRSAKELADPNARVLDLANAVFTHNGAVEKRPGLQALSTSLNTALTGSIIQTVGRWIACFTRGSQLLATDGDGLYSWAPSVIQWSSVAPVITTGNIGSNDRVSPCVATREPILTGIGNTAQGNAGPSALGVAEGAGLRVVTWQDVSGDSELKFSVYDLATGAVFASAIPLGTGLFNAIPIIQGTSLYIFYSDASHIYYNQYSTTGLVLTSTGALVSDAANSIYDATPYTGASSGILIAYNQTGQAGHVRYLRLENLPTVTITASAYTPYRSGGGAGDGVADVITCRVDSAIGLAFIAWEPSSGATNYLLVAAYNVPGWTQYLLAGSANAFAPTVPGYTQGGSQPAGFINIEPVNNAFFLIQCIWGTAGGPYPGQAVYTNASGALANSTTYPYGFIAGRCIRVTCGITTRVFVPFCAFEQITSGGSAFQFATIYLMDTRALDPTVTPHLFPRVVATLAPRQASEVYYATTMQSNGSNICRPPLITNIGNPTAGIYRFPIALNASEEWQTAASPTPVVIELATVNFNPGWSYAEGNAETYFAGGVPSTYAMQGFNELGFHMWPSRMGSAQSTGGSLTLTATYGYAFVFSEVDPAGLIHRSSAYLTSVTLTGGNNQVTWTIPVIPYTQRATAVVEVYRTAANGTTYYYIGNVSAYGASITSTVTYVDSATDTSITSNAFLYTTGGVLDSVNPPSFRQIISHVQRLWGIDDSGYVVWFSTPFPSPGAGGDAPYFNEGFTLQFTDAVLTGIWGMDDKLLAFTAGPIYYVEGYGPNNLGQGSDLTQATVIPSPEGAAGWQSFATIPNGTVFQGPSGRIYLLDRGLNVTHIGQEVQDFVSTGSGAVLVVSAQTVSANNHVRFILSNGTVLTYDYVLERWARLSYTASIFGTPITAVMVGPVWTTCGSNGAVAQDKLSAWQASSPFCCMDSTAVGANTFVPLTITTAWFKPGALQGWVIWGPVLGMGSLVDPCDVHWSLSFDYGTQTQGPQTVTYAQLSYANATSAQWEMSPMNIALQSEAIQATLTDAAPTGGVATTGAGLRWLGLSFSYEPIGAQKRTIAAPVKG